MDKRSFTKLCKSRGFAQIKPDFYARCIGDGVYQTIDISWLQYVDPFSPEYSPEKRKEKSILIGIWSLYSEWTWMHTSLDFHSGDYVPHNLLGEREILFNGFSSHCKIMEEAGFDFLDAITDQEKLLDAKLFTDKNIVSGKWVHNFWLAAPLMACQRWDEATYEVCRHITHSWDTFCKNYGDLKADEQYRLYLSKEDELQKRLETARYLWHLLLVHDEQGINAFLSKNYAQNEQWLKEHNIPFL